PARDHLSRPHRPRDAVDGRLSRKLPRADAQRYRRTARPDRTGAAGGRCPACARQGANPAGTGSCRSAPLMRDSILFTLPEVILSVVSLLLLLVGAWAGDERTDMVSIASVVALVMAGIVAACPSYQGVAFNGLYVADAFSSFAKVLIYGAASVS